MTMGSVMLHQTEPVQADARPPAPEAVAPGGTVALSFPVEGLSCAACAGRVERALAALPGARDVSVNLASRRAALRLPADLPPSLAADAVAQAGYAVPETTTLLVLEGLSCASCVGRVERALAEVPGVTSASVNLATRRAEIRHRDGIVGAPALAAAVETAGYSARPAEVSEPGTAPSPQHGEAASLRRDLALAVLLSLPVVVLDMGGHLVPAFGRAVEQALPGGGAWIQAVLASLVLAGPGRRFFAKGLPGLLRGAPDMNALVALGAGAAYLFSLVSTLAAGALPEGAAHLYFEASVLIVTLVLAGRLLEARARGRAGEAIARLLALTPPRARLLRDGIETEVEPRALRVGDVVRVRPGERLPADGTVVAGSSFVDESMVTGEAASVAKGPGASVVGGTLNGAGSLDLRVDAVGADSVLARITRLVETAQGAKLPIQALVDRVTGRFVPAVIAASLATFAAWMLLGPAPALGPALVHAVAVLIIACPCAMGLATPTSIMVGTGRAAEKGILFRDGAALQRLREAKAVALDKTGTLTEGRPRLTGLVAVAGIPENEVLALAAAVEARSEHPLARAIREEAEARHIPLAPAETFSARAGYGVSADVGGRRVAVGAARFMEALSIDAGALAEAARGLAEAGASPVFVAADGRLAGLFGIADPVKEGAREAVAALRRAGLHVAMVTGDDRRTALAVARSLGIEEVEAEILPEGKLAAVKALRGRHGAVAFVGDGINDAPALAEADIGIAIGTGTDVAVESADVVLMSGSPATLVEATALSRAAMANIRQNLFWAFAYNVLLVPVAAGVLVPFGGPSLSPALAAGAMALSSVFVVGNALRLRRA